MGARSSAVEHCLDMAVVTGSIPVVPTIFPCFFTIFSSQKSGMQTHSRVQWRDEFAGTNYLARVNEIRRVNPMGRLASFVRSETVNIERLKCL